MKLLPVYILLSCLGMLASCRESPSRSSPGFFFSSDRFDKDDFAGSLKKNLSGIAADPPDSSEGEVIPKLAAVYAANHFYPLWLQEDGTAPRAIRLLDELDSLWQDGLYPSRYHIGFLRKRVLEFTDSATLSLSEVLQVDTLLTLSYLHAAGDLLTGIIVPASVDSVWYHPNDSSGYYQQVLASVRQGDFLSLDSFRSLLPLYRQLGALLRHYHALESDSAFLSFRAFVDSVPDIPDSVAAAYIKLLAPWLKPISDSIRGNKAYIQAYQQFHGLRRTGVRDSLTRAFIKEEPGHTIRLIQANMERLRWLPRQLEDRYVLVNIPAMELLFCRNGEHIMRMNTVIGTVYRQTPSLMAPMTNVIINPPWGVPPTILRKDVLPGIRREGSAYLKRKGLTAYDFNGRPVDAGTISAENYKRYVFRQAPGPSNALGYIKFHMPNVWDIYLHDTPNRSDFTKYNRSKSSGCVRIQRPREMASYILTEIEGRRYPEERIDSVIAAGKTRWETVRSRLPVHMVYLTAITDVSGDHARFAWDVYGKDQDLISAIARYKESGEQPPAVP